MALRKLELMHRMFGKDEAHTCGECKNMVEGRYRSRTLRKCRVYGLTHSEASDWAKRWTACGKFNSEYAGMPIIELVRPNRTDLPVRDDPREGQLSMNV